MVNRITSKMTKFLGYARVTAVLAPRIILDTVTSLSALLVHSGMQVVMLLAITLSAQLEQQQRHQITALRDTIALSLTTTTMVQLGQEMTVLA